MKGLSKGQENGCGKGGMSGPRLFVLAFASCTHTTRDGLRGSIRGLKVYPNLASVDRAVDMVEVFRKPEDLYDIAKQAIDIGAKVLWGQIGVVDHDAARLAEEAGLKVVMDRCPKIELFRPFWKPKLHLGI